MNYVELFKKIAKDNKRKIAIVDSNGARNFTYYQLDKLSDAVADKLHKLGAKKSDFIIINLNRSVRYIAAYLGILKAGLVAVPIIPEYPELRVNAIKEDCKPFLEVKEDFFNDLDKYVSYYEKVDDLDNALLVYTSGSTGKPKGILHTVGDFYRSAIRHKPLYDGIDHINYAASGELSFAIHMFEYFTVFSLAGSSHILPHEARKDNKRLNKYYVDNKINVGFISPQMLRLFKYDGKDLKTVITGSERLRKVDISKYKVINIYGMTEATGVTSIFVLDKQYDNTPVGKAFDGLYLMVADEKGKEVKDGVEGEICMCGPFNTSYFNDPDKTKKTMVKSKKYGTIIHSSDKGYKNENGDVVFVERSDWMVKINGMRVDTLEVESVLNDIEGVETAVVKAFEDSKGSNYLVAYYVSNKKISDNTLRNKLKQKVTYYMIPRYFVNLPKLPTNVNGKIDRSKLLSPAIEDFRNDYVKPENEIQVLLCHAFEIALGIDKVGIKDDFISLGGDSLATLRLIDAANIDRLNPTIILQGRTPEKIEKILNKAVDTSIKHYETIKESYDLTENQRGILFDIVSNRDTTSYNIPVCVYLPKEIEDEKLTKAINKVVSLHDILNTNIKLIKRKTKLIVVKRKNIIEIKNVDDLDKEIDNFIRPFNLLRDALYRFEIVHVKDKKYLLFDIHHIVFDGSSVSILIKQIFDAYDGKKIEKEKLSLFDLCLVEDDRKNSSSYKDAQEFYDTIFTNAEINKEMISDQLEEVKEYQVGKINISTNDYFSLDEVSKFIKKLGVTENTFFMAGFAYALAKFTGNRSSYFSSVNSGRFDARMDNSIGMFVQTLPLYFEIDDGHNTSEFVQNVQKYFFTTMEHSDMAFSEIAQEHDVSIATSFVYQGALGNPVNYHNKRVFYDLLDTKHIAEAMCMMIFKLEDSFSIRLRFDATKYSNGLMESFTNMYLNILKQMMTTDKLQDIVLIDEKAKRDLDKINETEVEYDESSNVIDLFKKQVKLHKDDVCVVYEDHCLTYKEVDELSDKLAKHLVNEGLKKDDVVAILINRSHNFVPCILGVLKANASYMPIDATYPVERINQMVEVAKASYLIVDEDLDDLIGKDLIDKRLYTSKIYELNDEAKLPSIDLDGLFTIIFTSGSTGVPKGVMMEHRNVLCSVLWFKKYLHIDEKSRVASYASFGFDAHIADFYPLLISGGQIHVISEELRLDLNGVKEYFNENGITNVIMTTQIGRKFALIEDLKTLKHLAVAGEKLPPIKVRGNLNLYNLYGPSEGSVVTSGTLVDKYYKDVPIGKPVDNLKVYVVDKNGRLLPNYAVGELWIAGIHVTRGYINNPEKTYAAYGTNSFDNDPKYERVYHTGDVVRLLNDGNIQYIGRHDMQIKIRGYRIELTEIDDVIDDYPGIKDVTTVVYNDNNNDKYIVSYVVSDSKVDFDDLKQFISNRKPSYMIPSVIMQIDEIPLNQNHKVNKKALPKPQRVYDDKTMPENDLQNTIYNIVVEALGHGGFGINTSFYEAGLSSVGIASLTVKLSQIANRSIRISDINIHNTVKKLEEYIKNKRGNKTNEVGNIYPFSKTQEGILFECLKDLDSFNYHMPLLLKISDDIDEKKLVKAIKDTIDAHPYIKVHAGQDSEHGFFINRRDDAEPVVSLVYDKLPELNKLVTYFDSFGDLYHINVYKSPEGTYLFMDFHHIIFDGQSELIFMNDIQKAYNGESLQKEEYTAYEYALEEQERLKSEEYGHSKNYYKSLLTNCDIDILPSLDTKFGKHGTGKITFNLDIDESRVNEYCENIGISLNAFFNGVFGYLLSVYKNSKEITYATVYNGRSDSRIAESISMFVKTLPVVCDFSLFDKIEDYCRAMSKQLFESMSNDLYPFADICKDYGLSSDILFVYQNTKFDFEHFCDLPCEKIDIVLEDGKAPISCNVYPKKGKFEVELEYNRELFGRWYLSSMADSFNHYVNEFLTKENFDDIVMISDSQKEKLDIFNETDAPYKCNDDVVTMFKKQVKLHPDNLCVCYLDKKYTYKEVDEITDNIASYLVSKGIGKEDVVGIMINRNEYMVIASLGVLKANAAYEPLDSSLPESRLKYMLEDTNAKLVISDEDIVDVIKDYEGEVLLTKDIPSLKKAQYDMLSISLDDLFIVLYTSGSTGVPKGVMLEHRNIAAFANWYSRFGQMNSESRSAAYASYGFDACMMDIYPALVSGACVYIIENEIRLNFMKINEFLNTNEITHCVFTTQLGRQLSQIINVPSLKNLVVGGEALVPMEPIEDYNFLNCYGPSECTVCVTAKNVDRLYRRVPVGKQINNIKLYIVDQKGRRLPIGAPGELLISGRQVARGYLNKPDKTASSFSINRYDEDENYQRVYHTGDIARFEDDGSIDFLGRNDSQVKIRGFRIELAEVEEAIRQYEGIKDATVAALDNPSGGKYLAAYVVSDKKIDSISLREFVGLSKPAYMVPAVVMQIDEIPLTNNQKVNKKALPIPTYVNEEKEYVAPTTALESLLCDIFKKVLDLDKVSIKDNFFDCGGSSLSAAKVTMLLMSDKIDVEYGDIYDHPTVELLARYIETKGGINAPKKEYDQEIADNLKYVIEKNDVVNIDKLERNKVGDVLLTGATGFLGIHVLKQLIDVNEGHIYCLMRKGKRIDAYKRFKVMMMYYFNDTYEELLNDRITIIEADITDVDLINKLADISFDTIINCAANVKHYAADDILHKINVEGVENLIDIAKTKDATLIQISTVSIAGIHSDKSYKDNIQLSEKDLFTIRSFDNKYCLSKYEAEEKVIEAISNGLKAKIIRVGNLMARYSDEEFQINFMSNLFMDGIRGFAFLHKFPETHKTDQMRFSPVDLTAKAVVLLSGTNAIFNVYNAENDYSFNEERLIEACRKNGMKIEAIPDKEYYEMFNKGLGNISTNELLNGLAANDRPDLHAVETSRTFTVEVLKRLGFKWHEISDNYLYNMINKVKALGFFDEIDNEQ